MDENKSPVTFGNVVKEADTVKKSKEAIAFKSKPSVSSYIRQRIEKDVDVLLMPSDEDYTKLKTLQDLVALDKRNSNLIVQLEPPLCYKFIDASKHCIKTYVNVGDVVDVRRKCKSSEDENKPNRKVVRMYLKSLTNMSSIIAVLDDGDFYPANHLEKVK